MTTAQPTAQTPARSQEPTHHHRDVSGGWLRPTVFGAMDGLVTNVSLIAGVGGGGANRSQLILAGLAGLVAGAFSMATGEYTSVQSQNELVHAEVELERRELARNPEREKRELAEAFVDKGVEPQLAREVAEQEERCAAGTQHVQHGACIVAQHRFTIEMVRVAEPVPRGRVLAQEQGDGSRGHERGRSSPDAGFREPRDIGRPERWFLWCHRHRGIDVDVRQQPVEPLRQPPVELAEQ